MNELKRVLIIEDDKVIRKFLRLALQTNEYDVDISDSGCIGLNMISQQHFDLILLDLGLPDIDGIEIIKEIRKLLKTPIIVISARDRESDKVLALDTGANDYITKPFNVGEVLARVRVALRNSTTQDIPKLFNFKDITIDFEKRIVKLANEMIHFTPIEFKILELFVENQGKVLTHSYIQKRIWGYQTLDDYQSLRVFMASIRRKIEKNSKNLEYIVTEVGVGYRLKDD